IDFENSSKDQVKIFPEPDKANAKITSVDFFNNFLILSTDIGHLQYFSTEDWKMVNEYRHTCGIRSLFAQSYGTMLIFLDDKMDSFLYNPINDNLFEIPDIKGQIKGVLWENAPSEKDIFVVYDSNNFHTYAFHRDTIEGCKLVCAGHSKLNHDHTPLSLFDGTVNCLTCDGKVGMVQLATHKLDTKFRGGVSSEIDIKFKLLLTLKKHKITLGFRVGRKFDRDFFVHLSTRCKSLRRPQIHHFCSRVVADLAVDKVAIKITAPSREAMTIEVVQEQWPKSEFSCELTNDCSKRARFSSRFSIIN
uniref:WDR19 WD40 repeat domain-containing protein n=1 Tax=Romanomermis culicivorax TaxID=13658 RepID=A0A915K2V5_ROMCU